MGSFANFETDFLAFAISAAIVAGYYAFLNMKVRANPTYTIHGVNALARTLWVEHIMRNNNKDIMAVQTMRNFIMGSSLMASTAALLIIGTLTLSGQAEHIAQNWHALSLKGSFATELWIVKVMFLLLDFIVAFFAFSMSVRLANHVVFMVNVTEHDARQHVCDRHARILFCRAAGVLAVWPLFPAGLLDRPGHRALPA
jgi:uncharacterized membrane protein